MLLVAVIGGPWLVSTRAADSPRRPRAAQAGAGDRAAESVNPDLAGDRVEPLDEDLGELDELLDADLNQLVHTEVVVPIFSEVVTTVARQESTVGRSAAAVYVITGEMIRRSGARSIPEALRLAPGVQVARIDANKWAVSIRGFNQQFANKLLVLIDGRTVYTPLFAGVYWDVQDVLLDDVNRIEIIRGPGASVWGQNAVNGVISIITKRAKETPGFFAEGGGGSERGFASARVGGQAGNLAWRAYGKWFERNAGFSPTGDAHDDWRMGRFGFRTDWQPSCCDKVTFQGDYYDGEAGQVQVSPLPTPPFVASGPDNQRLAGGNMLLRWTHATGEESDWSLQLYYDRTERTIDGIEFREDRDTVDVDFQHRFPLAARHSLIWGFGYRNTRDRIRNTPFQLRFLPAARSDDLFSTFVQDEMTLLKDRLFFTAGSKFSWNDYTGFEFQPTARLLYTPSNRQTVWASVSRAVRVPSRASDDVRSITAPVVPPVFPAFLGNRGVQSEQLLAWELGMRAAPTDSFFWDLAAFYNRYEDLQTVMPGAPGIDPITGVFILPLQIFNGSDAESYGFELSCSWKVRRNWTLRGAYSLLKLDVHPSPLAAPVATEAEGKSPRNQLFIHSSWDLGCHWEFDLIGRYTDRLSAIETPAYFELDARLAWQPTDALEFAVVGRNLLDRAHPEFTTDANAGALATEVQREVYGSMTWRY